MLAMMIDNTHIRASREASDDAQALRALHQEVDELLREWWCWSACYTPQLHHRHESTYCSNSVTSRQWEDSTTASCSRLRITMLKNVEFCIDQLPGDLRGVIGIEVRNKFVNHKVWRHPSGKSYGEARSALIPILRREGCLQG